MLAPSHWSEVYINDVSRLSTYSRLQSTCVVLELRKAEKGISCAPESKVSPFHDRPLNWGSTKGFTGMRSMA